MNSPTREQKQAAFIASSPAQQQVIIDWDCSHRCERCNRLHKVCGDKPCDRCDAAGQECIGRRSGHRFSDLYSDSESDEDDQVDRGGDDEEEDGEGGEDDREDGDAGSEEESAEQEVGRDNNNDENGDGSARESAEVENIAATETNPALGTSQVANEYPPGTVGAYRHEQTSLAEFIRDRWDDMPDSMRLQRINPRALEYL